MNDINIFIEKLKEKTTKIDEIPKIESFIMDEYIYSVFKEVLICYVNGANRATIILSFAIVEYIFRKVLYKEPYEKMKKLIERAYNQKIFSFEESNFLQSMTKIRNTLTHDISTKIQNADAKLILLILVKILNKEKQIKLLS